MVRLEFFCGEQEMKTKLEKLVHGEATVVTHYHDDFVLAPSCDMLLDMLRWLLQGTESDKAVVECLKAVKAGLIGTHRDFFYRATTKYGDFFISAHLIRRDSLEHGVARGTNLYYGLRVRSCFEGSEGGQPKQVVDNLREYFNLAPVVSAFEVQVPLHRCYFELRNGLFAPLRELEAASFIDLDGKGKLDVHEVNLWMAHLLITGGMAPIAYEPGNDDWRRFEVVPRLKDPGKWIFDGQTRMKARSDDAKMLIFSIEPSWIDRVTGFPSLFFLDLRQATAVTVGLADIYNQLEVKVPDRQK